MVGGVVTGVVGGSGGVVGASVGVAVVADARRVTGCVVGGPSTKHVWSS